MHSTLFKDSSSQTEKSVHTTKSELLIFLRLLDTNPIIKEFLHYDNSFRLADKYLIAMVFIYFKRAQLNPEDYTYLNFFAGLCLAHSMEEDIDLSCEIYSWALGPNEVKDQLPKLLQLKLLLWEAMNYRAAVSRHCCKQLISISQNHPVWRRKRTTSDFQQIFPTIQPNFINDFKEINERKEKKHNRRCKRHSLREN